MTIIRVQGNARATGSNVSPLVITQNAAPASGNLNILTFSANQTTISSISQTGVIWMPQIVTGFSGNDSEIWVGIVGAGASATINVTLAAASGFVIANVCEYNGLSGLLGFLDKTAINHGSSASSDSGTTGTTTQTTELWVASIFATGVGGGVQTVPTNGFTLLDGAGFNTVSNGFLEKIVSATGTANTGTSISGTSPIWVGCVATFLNSAATMTFEGYPH